MNGHFLIYYDWHWSDDAPYEACVLLPHDRTIFAQGKTFEEAKEKLIEQIKAIPEDEWVEIC